MVIIALSAPEVLTGRSLQADLPLTATAIRSDGTLRYNHLGTEAFADFDLGYSPYEFTWRHSPSFTSIYDRVVEVL